jgi:hypothetical protein
MGLSRFGLAHHSSRRYCHADSNATAPDREPEQVPGGSDRVRRLLVLAFKNCQCLPPFGCALANIAKYGAVALSQRNSAISGPIGDAFGTVGNRVRVCGVELVPDR